MSATRGIDAFGVFERDGWITAATAYAEFFGPITGAMIDALLDEVDAGPGTDLLDVACGPGGLLAAAARRGVRPHGIDLAEPMVALARRGAPGARVEVADAHALPFDDGRFDAVVASFVVMHLSHPVDACREWARVLRPGGRLAITAWDRPSQVGCFGWLLDAIAAAGADPPEGLPDGPPFFQYADDAELAGLLDGAGLGEVAIRTVSHTHRAGSTDEIWTALLKGTVRTSALLRGQTTATLGHIREHFDARASAHRTGRGRIEIPISVKLGTGTLPA